MLTRVDTSARGIGQTTGRRGGHALVIVVLFTLVLAVLGLHQAFLSGTVLDEAAAEHLGAMALTLAESALEEVSMAVRSAVNDPAHPLHGRFRRKVGQARSVGFEVSGLSGTSRRTRALTHWPPYAAFGFEVVTRAPRVTHRTPFDGDGAHGYDEHSGAIAYEVTVRTTRGRPRVERTLRATQEFKVVAAVIPRPFDQVRLFLLDPASVVGGREASDLAEHVARDIKTPWLADLGDASRSAAAMGAAGVLDEVIDEFRRIPAFDRAWEPGGGVGGAVHAFEPEMVAFETPDHAAANPRLPGGEVELAPRLAPWRAEVDALDREARRRMDALEDQVRRAIVGGGPPPQAALDELLGALRRLARRAGDVQEAIRRWQEAFGEVVGPAIGDARAEARRLSADALRAKAVATIEEGRGRDATAEFRRFRAAMRARTGSDALAGIVWVDNPTSGLDLRGETFPGRVVIATSGDVIVGRTRKARPADHLAVVAQGRMRIQGPVVASLAAMGELSVDGPSTIEGGLVMSRLGAGTLADVMFVHDPNVFTGRATAAGVEYDERYVHVAVSPVLASREVERSRPLVTTAGGPGRVRAASGASPGEH